MGFPSYRSAGALRFVHGSAPQPRYPRRYTTCQMKLLLLQISGIVHVLRSGGRWVDAPAVYGPRKTLYNRFVRWAAKGVWQRVFRVLARAGGPPAELLLDSSHVKAHRSAGGGKGGSARKPSGGRAAGGPPRSTR
jgi:transposase